MDQDVTLAGNFYATVVDDKAGRRLRRMRPDWVSIVSASFTDPGNPDALDAHVVGYLYTPRDPFGAKQKSILLSTSQVVHYSPYPDPMANWRGMSWLTPVVRNVQSHAAATVHKQRFFENGAQLSTVVRYDKATPKAVVQDFIELFKAQHEGSENAYRTLHLGGGADVTTVGTNMRDLEFKAVQGADETIISAAARVPAIIVGLSEGLDAATYSNFAQARRSFADQYARPHWRMASASLESVLPVPSGAHLWYDDRDIAFLREDAEQAAKIQSTRMSTVAAGVTAGFTPTSVVAAVEADDFNQLVHTNLFSVQLQPAGASASAAGDPVPAPVGSA